MFLILELILLFVIFGNSVHVCSEVIGNYTNFSNHPFEKINDKSYGISLFSSQLKGCFKYHNDLPLNLYDARNAIPGETPWAVLIIPILETYTGDGTTSNWLHHVHVNPILAKDYVNSPTDYYSRKVYIHPKYNNNNQDASYDIALISLHTSVNITPGIVNTICLPPERNFTYIEEQYAMMSGWNSLYISDNMELNRIQIAYLKVSSHTQFVHNDLGGFPDLEVNDSYSWPGYIYGKKLNKQKICLGDSGSPVWQYHHGRAVLIGLISRAHGIDCQPNEFTGHNINGTSFGILNETLSLITWVPNKMDWVINVTQNN